MHDDLRGHLDGVEPAAHFPNKTAGQSTVYGACVERHNLITC
jgi:hypothetical protein